MRVQFTQLPIKIRYTHKMSDEFFIAIMRISFYNATTKVLLSKFRYGSMHACGVWSACAVRVFDEDDDDNVMKKKKLNK